MGVVWEPEAVRAYLGGLLPDELLDGFEKLAVQDGCPADEAEAFLGDARTVRALIDSGLAHVGSASPEPPRLVPAPPDLALEAALRRVQDELVVGCDRLLDGHRRLTNIAHIGNTSVGNQIGSPLVELVTDRSEITRRSQALVNMARRDWMSLETLQLETALDEATGYTPPPGMRASVRSRSIYEARVWKHPVAARIIAESIEQGEEARLLPVVRMKMKLVDEAVAMLPVTPTGMDGALIIRSAVIVSALREYFDLLWDRATPAGTRCANPGSLDEGHQQVLDLLAHGLTAKEIACRLRLSESTVHRRADEVRKQLGADTLFACGVAAVRRGWIQ